MSRSAFVVATLTIVSLWPSITSAQSACTPSEVVVVDRSRFTSTIERARTVIRDYGGGNGTGIAYVEGSDVSSFAKRVASFAPKVVVLHYSMFRPGKPDRGRVTASFLAMLEANATHPIKYMLYSSSLFDEEDNRQGRTLASLRADGFFAGVSDDRIALIYVDDGARFTLQNGAMVLGEEIRQFMENGGCGG